MDFTTTVTVLYVLLSADVVHILTEITTMPPVETHILHVRLVSDTMHNIKQEFATEIQAINGEFICNIVLKV